MHFNNTYCEKYLLSPPLTNRSDPRSIQDHNSTGGGDFTTDGSLFSDRRYSKTRVFDDKYSDDPTFSDDPAEWNPADYEFNINFLYNYMDNQRRYLKHDHEKYTRNKELLANLKTSYQQEYDDSLLKSSETKRLMSEIEGYEWEIRHQSALGTSSKTRFLAEKKLNKDLKEQKQRLLKEKEFQLRKQTEEGILEDVIDEYEAAKDLLEAEKDKRKRLHQKAQWYDTEIATIHEVLKQQENKGVEENILPAIEKSGLAQQAVDNSSNNASVGNFLPEIKKGRNNVITIKLFEEDIIFTRGQDYHNHPAQEVITRGLTPQPQLVKTTYRYVPHPPIDAVTRGNASFPQTSTTTIPHLPQPPSGKKRSGHRRFNRKMKNTIK